KLGLNPGPGVVPAGGKADGGVKQAVLTDAAAARGGFQSSLDLGKRLAGFGPLDASDPSTQFCLQAARRGLGDVGGPLDWYAKFKGYVAGGPYHEAAQAELWLAARSPHMPRKLARCRL